MSTVGIGVIGLVVLVVVIGLAFLVLLGVIIPIIMNNRKATSSEDAPKTEESQVKKNFLSSDEKKEILEKLANKEISKEEADQKLKGMG